VRPGTATATLTLVNVGTGDTYDQSTAAGAGLWAAAEDANTSDAPTRPQTTIVTSTDGRLWTPAGVIPFDHVDALAWGNGTWIAAAGDGAQESSPLLESTDLHTWRLVTTLPDLVQGIAYANGRWTAVGALISGSQSKGVVWGSTDGVHWVRVATISAGPAPSQSLDSVAYGGGQWIAIQDTRTADPTSAGPGTYLLNTLTSTDGIHWGANGGSITNAVDGHIAYGAGQWTIGAIDESQTPGASASQAGVVDVSTDGRSWVSKPTVGIGGTRMNSLAYGNGEWLGAAVTSVTGSAAVDLSTTFVASGDAATWSSVAHVAQTVLALAFGGASTLNGTQTPTSPATTTPAGTSAGSTPPSSTPSPAAANVGKFAGTWEAHELKLVIDNTGTGHLSYADFALCPSCSYANAPLGTDDFVLTSVTNGVATGHVTATSDPKNDAIGAPVHAKLTPGSPGQLLAVDISGNTLVSFCNSTSAGQCGG
jgi:hypothetical protein